MTKKRHHKDVQIPVLARQLLTLQVEGLNHDGEGVARFEGFTVFVPGAVPGDLITARVISLKKTYARALVEDILRPSAGRAAPRCLHDADCGGCQLQHLVYEEQLKHKEKLVEDALRRLGGLNVPVLPAIGMKDPWNYRNKAQIPVGQEAGRVLAGFYKRRSHSIVDIRSCPVQLGANDEVFSIARTAIKKSGVPVYDEEAHSGNLRHVIARTALSTGETLIALITRERELPQQGRLVEAFTSGVNNLVGIVQNVNPRRGNAIFGPEDITLWGRPYLEERLGGLVFRISPRSFFQVNTVQAETLFEKVREYAQLSGEETVFDLYCGTGTIALYASRFARRVIGVESVEPAVQDARQNARLNGIDNAEFFLGKAELVVPELMEAGHKADVVVVDPPRGGCEPELLQTISSLKPRKVVYVSCNPASLARDLKYLVAQGYTVSKIQPVDMFPHTSHVECVVLISRVEKY